MVEGEDGVNVLFFNGSGADENIDISANGQRVLFTRNVGNIVMDLNDVLGTAFNALGGADNIVVNDLSGTDVTQIAINLAGTLFGTTGDGEVDTVTITSTNGNDVIGVIGTGTSAFVVGLAASVTITQAEGANDALTINALAGDNVINAQPCG